MSKTFPEILHELKGFVDNGKTERVLIAVVERTMEEIDRLGKPLEPVMRVSDFEDLPVRSFQKLARDVQNLAVHNPSMEGVNLSVIKETTATLLRVLRRRGCPLTALQKLEVDGGKRKRKKPPVVGNGG